MKGQANIVSGIHHLLMAREHFESFRRDHQQSKGDILFKGYTQRITWILTDLKTHPHLPEPVREGIKKEIESDVFAVPAINEKISLLKPEHREQLETIIDRLINGEELIVENVNEEYETHTNTI